ncbi:hypothetical protein LIER_39352 [Lithospermum erythrorhizon]|uniref:Reverse transcriptase zinc-binding domain-containing protein n=1 Tax=Lithospermum erythrorhizon TaxID=34254 RepID=A0AAV3QG20_LITER
MIEKLRDLKVSDLIDDEIGVWDVRKVRSLFYPIDSEAILQISLNRLGSRDIPLWANHHGGKFTVKAAYQHIVQSGTNMVNMASSRNSNPQTYKRLWKMKVPRKVIHFFYNAIHNRLATTDNLVKPGVNVDRTCSLCQTEEESIMHVSQDCYFTREVNRQLNIKNIANRVLDFRDLFLQWIICWKSIELILV